MNQRLRWTVCCAALAGLCLVTRGVTASQQTAAVRVLKMSSGATGQEQNGSFVLTSERSVFNRTDDKQVIVLFQWEGTPGAHKLIAQWRSPDGGLTSNSAIDYQAAAARFGAYWTMPITATMSLGIWSVEATVDGVPAGRFSFEITDRTVPSAIVKRPMTQPELYERLSRQFVVMQRQGPPGVKDLDSFAGLAIGGGRVATAMATFDNAERVLVLPPGGTATPVGALLAWNRQQDWAVFEGAPPAITAAPAAAEPVKIGDRCYSMEGDANGARVLAEGSITGQGPAGGPAFVANFVGGSGTPGAPVLNEFGELIGMIGAAGVPGPSRLFELMRFRAQLRGAPIVPAALLIVGAAPAPTPVAGLRGRGEILAPVALEIHVLMGGFTRAMTKDEMRGPTDTREDFSLREPSFAVYLQWLPRDRVRGQMMLSLFDGTSQLVGTSKASNVDFRKGASTLSQWQMPMVRAPGIYRAEVAIDGAIAWRGFVRITP
ncbi:MAG TPA: trypsin-like peptidase domain-containing protein [Vicinamibacterales bacterium]|nr:trypsin-like peptidase domain-containing protein [Vicinamibacterales bacterium]